VPDTKAISKLGIGSESADIPPMQTVTLSEAQEHLTALVRGIAREGELLITDADIPVAMLSPVTQPTSLRDLRPASVGAILRPFPSPQDDTLFELCQH
jgi:antitoxin (DNA-binding transcriptional repressor) of toxin-antitoxin stability system